MGVEFNSNFNKKAIEKEIWNATEKGVRKGIFLIEGDAVRNAPIDTSALRQSSESEVNRRGTKIEATISFNTPYAKIQEENESFNHPKGGGAHYLKNAVRRGLPNLKKYVADELKKMRIKGR